jgi:acetyl-CoA carboxylase biotin carboxylase subunit
LSYLNIPAVISAAEITNVQAIHPGYGFLSENPRFARACAEAGVKFIGPPPEAMEAMGSKTAARERMQAAGVPVVPGTVTPLRDVDEAVGTAADIGYPVMLKAAAGGGGKGMRLVASAAELPSAFRQAQSEALNAFGDDAVYLEKAIVRPRHVEVQVLADEHGACIHLGERECSLQRRHQKIVEETPSPLLEGYDDVREQLTSAAVRAALAVDYSSAGTIEMLMDAERNFYFLEMNTRLQVEHPVTELVTGLDLVREQILIAAGQPLRCKQEDITPRGWAMQCRVYAEDPARNFFPSPGKITMLERPGGPNVRLDSGAYAGWTVPLDYDPLLAKLCAWAPTRGEVIAKLRAALAEYHIGGIETTLPFFRALMCDAEFQAGDIDTGFVDRFLAAGKLEAKPAAEDEPAALATAAVAYAASQRKEKPAAQASNGWKQLGRQRALR